MWNWILCLPNRHTHNTHVADKAEEIGSSYRHVEMTRAKMAVGLTVWFDVLCCSLTCYVCCSLTRLVGMYCTDMFRYVMVHTVLTIEVSLTITSHNILSRGNGFIIRACWDGWIYGYGCLANSLTCNLILLQYLYSLITVSCACLPICWCCSHLTVGLWSICL